MDPRRHRVCIEEVGGEEAVSPERHAGAGTASATHAGGGTAFPNHGGAGTASATHVGGGTAFPTHAGDGTAAATIDTSTADQIAAFLAADPRMPRGGLDALLEPGAFPSGMENNIADVTETLDLFNFGLMTDILRENGRGMVPVTREDAFAVGPSPPSAVVVSRAQEEEMMRQALPGEQACMLGENCAAMALKPRGFVAVALPVLNERGENLQKENFCVFCCRVLMNRLILKSLVSDDVDEAPIQVNYANIAGSAGEYDLSQCLFTTRATRYGVFAPVVNHCIWWYTTEYTGDHVLVARQTGYKTVNFPSGAPPT